MKRNYILLLIWVIIKIIIYIINNQKLNNKKQDNLIMIIIKIITMMIKEILLLKVKNKIGEFLRRRKFNLWEKINRIKINNKLLKKQFYKIGI